MLKRISYAFEGPARLWCKLKHPAPMWPISGYYRCPECLRQYPVLWEAPQSLPHEYIHEDVRIPGRLRPELLPLRSAKIPLAVQVN
jgi:hypothetical protein